ncbi:MAG: HlyD family type I secretion periplasmic adaptor subunit [Rhizobiales bacterium]|nr:HlyD family type I secretion periplasmic adaptor subunit [Hyphomicrobiales bacterium]
MNIFKYEYINVGKAPLNVGLYLFMPILTILVVWTIFAPLNSAAIAPGKIILDLNRKIVQHYEGGIIQSILVKEGQSINENDTIIVIQSLSHLSEMNPIRDQILNFKAQLARLFAEKNNLKEIEFSVVKSFDIPDDRKNYYINIHQDVFENNRLSLSNKEKILNSKKRQTLNEIIGLKALHKSKVNYLKLNKQLLVNSTNLNEKGIISNTSLIEQKKQIVLLEGEIENIKPTIAKLKEIVMSIGLEKNELLNEFQKNNLNEIQTTTTKLLNLEQQLITLQDRIKRTVIKAPVSGRVLDLQVHTKGAVISPGMRILDIIPDNDQLIVEARLSPQDIDVVRPKTIAKIQLSAYKTKKVPKIDGIVTSVSGDVLIDKLTGQQYFAVRLIVNEKNFSQFKNRIELYPGMPVDVFFISGERTLADYIISPIVDAAYRSFREE